MDPLNEIFGWFAGHWWIVFPLMGVGGAIAGRLQALSRQHHKQKLETLRLKGEIKAAQLAASGQIAPQPSPREVAQQHANASKELLERLFAEHDGITARWLDYELDVAKMISFPAMSDGRQPLTAAFLRAKKIADALRPSSSDAKVTEQQVTEYLDAVGNYAVAFEIAEKDARRLRDSTFTEDERKRLERAQHLLKVAIDQSATPAERQTAYRRVREELEGLIDLSDAAVENLEKKVALQLEPARAPEPATDPVAANRAASDPVATDPMPQPVADPLPVRDPLATADPVRRTAPLRNPEH